MLHSRNVSMSQITLPLLTLLLFGVVAFQCMNTSFEPRCFPVPADLNSGVLKRGTFQDGLVRASIAVRLVSSIIIFFVFASAIGIQVVHNLVGDEFIAKALLNMTRISIS